MPRPSCLPKGCAAFTPCLVSDPAVAAAVSQETFCTGLDREGVERAMIASYGRPAHRCLAMRLEGSSKAAASLRGAVLRVTGPVGDGFWVRVLVVFAHALWARTIGVPISVAYRSSHDSYLDARDSRRDGWTQFFEPLRAGSDVVTGPFSAQSPSSAEGMLPPSRLVQLDCYAAARAWEAYANYAPSYGAAKLQRQQRIDLVRTLPVEPRRAYRQAAAAFWRAHGLGGPNGTLGVHLRGTDKPGGRRRGVRAFLPLIRAYLCHRPLARVFVATDDATLLADLRDELKSDLPASRLVWREGALRSNSSLNPGFHAEVHMRS